MIFKLGQLQLAKNGVTKYFKIGAGVQPGSEAELLSQKVIEVLGSDTIFLNGPADKFTHIVASGKMTQAQADERIAKIPEFIRAEGYVKVESDQNG